MKIIRKELIEILEKIKPGLANKEIVESYIYFIFLNNKITTYNEHIAITHPLSIDFVGNVQSMEFYSLLKHIKKEEVQIEKKENVLQISSGHTKAGISLQTDIPPIVLDILKKLHSKKQWILLPKNFVDAVSICSPSVGKDVTRIEFTAIHIKKNIMETCDNYQFTRFKLSENFNTEILIPADSLKYITKINPNKYNISDGWIHFINKEQATYSCRLLSDMKYPDLSNLLVNKGQEIELPYDLASVLERTLVFADSDNIFEVNICLQNKWLLVKGKSSTGWIEDKLRLNYTGKPINFTVNPELLIKMVNKSIKVKLSKSSLEFKTPNFIHCCSIQTIQEGK